MKKYIAIFIAVLIPVAIGVFYYKFYNENNNLSVQCSFHSLTGMQCPGCGGQRAIHYLLHGNMLSALRYNAVFIIGLPFLLYLYYVVVQVYFFKNRKYMDSFVYSSRFGYVVLIVLIVFFIVRNIPVTPFTYLSPPQ